MRLIYTIALSILFFFESNSSFAVVRDQKNNFQIAIFKDSSNHLAIKEIKTILTNHPDQFIASQKTQGPFNPDETYWIYIQRIDSNSNQEYVLTFQMWGASIEVYPFPYTSIGAYGGQMVPSQLKELSDCSVFLKTRVNRYLLKFQNHSHSKVSIKSIEILPSHEFQKKKKQFDFFQGFIQGFFWLMIFYNLLLYLVLRKKLHLFYVIYIFLNSLYLLFVFGYSEVYILSYSYKLNLLLFTFQPISLFFYTMFIRLMMLNHCPAYTPAIDHKTLYPYSYLILLINLIIASTILYRIDIFIIASRISNLISSAIGIMMFANFYKKSDNVLHIIIIGSIIMIVFAFISIVFGSFNWLIDNISFEVGLLIELLLFSYAINKEHQYDVEKRYKVELEKHQLENKLENKNRELVYQAIRLSAKEEAMVSIKSKIGKLNLSKKTYTPLFNEIQANDSMNKNLWEEFELHFNETHPGFYKALLEKYSELTQSEIKLCAFLKLNLNTKEIAMITQKTAHSIEAMRSRIRQKMHLDRDVNLNLILSQL
jgi:hypothetical protein